MFQLKKFDKGTITKHFSVQAGKRELNLDYQNSIACFGICDVSLLHN